MTDELQVTYSSDVLLSDLRAALDSYAVEVIKDGKVHRRAPLHSIKPYGPYCNPLPLDFKFTLPAIDYKIEVRMYLYRVSAGSFARCPFFVESPFTITFLLSDQWWEYKFTPGKKYEDRKLDLR